MKILDCVEAQRLTTFVVPFAMHNSLEKFLVLEDYCEYSKLYPSHKLYYHAVKSTSKFTQRSIDFKEESFE